MYIFATLGIIFMTWLYYMFMITPKDNGKKETHGVAIFATIACGVIYVIIVGLIMIPIANVSVPTKLTYAWQVEIVAMQDSKSYIVSRHSVDQSDRYYYMVKSGDYYQSSWVSQNNTKIFMTDKKPYVVKTYIQERQIHNWFQKDMVRILKFLDYDNNNLDRNYEFYIPTGSLVQEFKVDLQ
jgi:hypothetical protein